MATVNYKENRVEPAYNNLLQAMTLSPNDKQIALSLLKVLVKLSEKQLLSASQLSNANKAATMLLASSLSDAQAEKCNGYVRMLGLEIEASNDDDNRALKLI